MKKFTKHWRRWYLFQWRPQCKKQTWVVRRMRTESQTFVFLRQISGPVDTRTFWKQHLFTCKRQKHQKTSLKKKLDFKWLWAPLTCRQTPKRFWKFSIFVQTAPHSAVYTETRPSVENKRGCRKDENKKKDEIQSMSGAHSTCFKRKRTKKLLKSFMCE